MTNGERATARDDRARRDAAIMGDEEGHDVRKSDALREATEIWEDSICNNLLAMNTSICEGIDENLIDEDPLVDYQLSTLSLLCVFARIVHKTRCPPSFSTPCSRL